MLTFEEYEDAWKILYNIKYILIIKKYFMNKEIYEIIKYLP